VYRVDEAIPRLVEYVAFSIAVGSRTMHTRLLTTLPGLLEPFAPLSPILDAMWQNAIATCECAVTAQFERARDRWRAVLAKLETVTGAELQHVESIRNAVAFGVGILEASFGLATATQWAELLAHNPFHRLSALHLRKIVRLEQGDWNGADALRREAELLALQSRAPQMFHFSLTVEISAYAHARDLIGVKQVIERYDELAAECEGWVPYLRDAQARFQLLRGDFAAARTSFEQCIALTALDEQRHSRMMAVWVSAQTGLAEALLALECVAQARESAASALQICESLEIGSHANELTRVLALAEAKQGDVALAKQRIDQLIERQVALGVSGLRLGLSYETRAMIAVCGCDEAAFGKYARLTAREYRYGADCPLGTRYARLMNEARRNGFQPVEDLDPIELRAERRAESAPIHSMLPGAQTSLRDDNERARSALRLVCDARSALGGHLYLMRAPGPQLVASLGIAPPPSSLGERVAERLALEHDTSEIATSIDHGALADRTSRAVETTAQAGGVSYELMPLTCVVAGTHRIVGAIALSSLAPQRAKPGQAKLLATLAAYLVNDAV
jgi:hypothetical protein